MRLAKVSKFRNAAATVPGRESWYTELPADPGSLPPSTSGLAIDAHSLYVRAASGNALHAVDVSQPGKASGAPLSALAGRLVDWTTAPCADDLVAAADDQGGVGVWRARHPLISFSAGEAATLTSVRFHPTAAGALATSAGAATGSGQVSLWNIGSGSAARFWSAATDGGAASVAFHGDGQLLAATTHAGVCAIYDPRSPGPAASSSTPAFYAPGRPSCVLWMGERPFVLTTGTMKTRERAAALWDQRSLSRPLATLPLEPSPKSLLPLYDEDTQLAYLAERGGTTIRWVDADPSSAAPLAVFGAAVLPAPIGGCALLPKPQLHVMGGEIARVHAVVAGPGPGQGAAIVPIAHVAPRRTYLDFHGDLFPDTRAPLPAQSFEQWVARVPACVPRMSLNPDCAAQSLAALRRAHAPHAVADSAPAAPPATVPAAAAEPVAAPASVAGPDCPLRAVAVSATPVAATPPAAPAAPTPAGKAARCWRPPPVSRARFKYLEGRTGRPSEAFTNLHNVLRLPQQGDPVRVGPKYIAIACTGAGGQVGIIRRDSPGRVPDSLATVVHGADVVDIAFDPFDPAIIATAGVDGRLQMWRVPDAPLCSDTSFELEEHLSLAVDRVLQFRFHPCARGVVAALVAVAGEHAVYVYSGLTLHFVVAKTNEGLHAFEWSPDGSCIAVVTKETKQLRVYDVRSQDLLGWGPALASARPCRIAWLGSSRICLSGFGHDNRRRLAIYSAADLSEPLDAADLDAAPGLLVPIVDADCAIIYLDDRGSRLTHAFEVVDDKLVELPKLDSLHPSLGLAALPKQYANVAQCEVLRLYRLGAQALEPLAFRVPRKRPEYFQDDIFPDTVDTESPSVDALAWLGGAVPEPKFISLQPQGMVPLSAAPPEAVLRRAVDEVSEQPVDNTKSAISAMLDRVDDAGAQGDDPPASDSDWDD